MDENKEGFEVIDNPDDVPTGTLMYCMFSRRYHPQLDRNLLTMFACTSGNVKGVIPEEADNQIKEKSLEIMELNDLLFAFFEMKKFILRLSRETGKDIYSMFMDHLTDMDMLNAQECVDIDKEFGIEQPEDPTGPTGIVPDGAVN